MKYNNLRYLYILIVFGILVSLYAYHVEISFEKSHSYKAYCDIGPHMSCSKVLTSKYSKGFGLVEKFLGKDSVINIPNCLYGVIFYCLQGFLYTLKPKRFYQAGLVLAILSNFATLYLAYILAFILHDLCLVCITTYFINGVMLFFTVQYYKYKTTLFDNIKMKLK